MGKPIFRQLLEGRLAVEAAKSIEVGDYFILLDVSYRGNKHDGNPNGLWAALTLCRRTDAGFTIDSSTDNLRKTLLLMAMPRFNRQKALHLAQSVKDEINNHIGQVWAAVEEMRGAWRSRQGG